MKTILLYIFPKQAFDIPEHASIEFENPPYIPESGQLIDIDYHSLLDRETADQIVARLESDKTIKPYKTAEMWGGDTVTITYEFMSKKINYKLT